MLSHVNVAVILRHFLREVRKKALPCWWPVNKAVWMNCQSNLKANSFSCCHFSFQSVMGPTSNTWAFSFVRTAVNLVRRCPQLVFSLLVLTSPAIISDIISEEILVKYMSWLPSQSENVIMGRNCKGLLVSAYLFYRCVVCIWEKKTKTKNIITSNSMHLIYFLQPFQGQVDS